MFFFGVVEKDNFTYSVICYVRLYIMKCKIHDRQIAIEEFHKVPVPDFCSSSAFVILTINKVLSKRVPYT